MKKFVLLFYISAFLYLGCTKDSPKSIAPTNPLPSDSLLIKSNSLLGKWKMTKASELIYEDGLKRDEHTMITGNPDSYTIRFTDEIYQNINNSKKVYDIGTGLTNGKLEDFIFVRQAQWSLFHKDSVAIAGFHFYIDKFTSSELQLVKFKELSVNETSITTWFLEK
jgi:hypothetical protein